MGLRQNGYRDIVGSVKFYGATLSNLANPYTTRSNTHMYGARRNMFGSFNEVSSVPDGVRHPVAIIMPQSAGGLSSRNVIFGVGSVTASLLAVKLAEASVSGSGAITSTGSLIVQLVAAIAGSGEISSADVKAFLQAAANLSGQGDVTAIVSAFAELIASIEGEGGVDALLTGIGALDADLVVTGTGLTTANVGSAVWQEILESGISAEEIMRILLAVAAGKTDITGSTVTFRDVDDTKDRVTADMTGSERTTITLDGSE